MASLAFAGAAQAVVAQDSYRNQAPGYGPLLRDPAGFFDLPKGFRYSVVSSFGEAMDDGYAVPDKFDGMGCFPIDRSRVALVRNHELKTEDRERGPTGGLPRLEQRLASEPHFGRDKQGNVLPGGTSTLIVNLRTGRRERQYLSLAGTAVNCAGGATPWGSWLSCEESVIDQTEVSQSHGWLFEVPAKHRGLVQPRALTAMGRFRHEAAAIDPRSGIVYMTEDRDDGLFYRFLPNDRRQLAPGGRLQALALLDLAGADTRNWNGSSIPIGERLAVRWIELADAESPNDDLRRRGHQQGAALFARGEGIHFGMGEFFFTCTSGGAAKLGQIMRYIPSRTAGRAAEKPGMLELFVESRDASVLDYGDNLTVAPWGDLIVCEDRTDGKANHLKGVMPDGRIYTFARLNADTELAGVCFSPDGRTMFVNAYSPGRTLAIFGPWGKHGRS
ncbi:MAG TPA: alkaline phosphatase PhoX [Sphingomicrobium sp.]